MFRTLPVMLFFILPLVAWADLESGPKVGDKVSELKVFGVVGSIENKEVDFAKERKDELTVYLFIQRENFSRPMARFMKTLDVAVKEIDEKIHVIAIFLGDKDKVDDIKEYLPKAQMSLSFVNTSLAVFPGEKSGPNGWGLNTDAHVTVTVTHKGKVIANHPFTTINETDVKKITEVLKKVVKK